MRENGKNGEGWMRVGRQGGKKGRKGGKRGRKRGSEGKGKERGPRDETPFLAKP